MKHFVLLLLNPKPLVGTVINQHLMETKLVNLKKQIHFNWFQTRKYLESGKETGNYHLLSF